MPGGADDLTVGILRRLSALERRVAAVVRVGCVAEVRSAPDYRVRVNLNTEGRPILTGWVPVVIPRAGETLAHSPLTVGEGVLLVSPGGVDAVSFAVGSLPSMRFAPAPADDEDDTTYFHGDLCVEGDVYIEGCLTVTGDVVVDGDVSAEGDVVAGPDGSRVRLLAHVHNPPLGGPPQRLPESLPERKKEWP